jgi:hypothetical protein
MDGINNMKKVIILSSLLATNIYANNSYDAKEELIKEGFNVDSAVTLVHSKELNLPKELQTDPNLHNRVFKTSDIDQKPNPKISELFAIDKMKSISLEKNPNPLFTGLRNQLNNLHMAYKFKPVPANLATKLIGFAASGTYNNGWSGASEFFVNNQVGTCSYTESNLKVMQEYEKIDKDVVTYDVNNKVTVIEQEGNKNYGYLYKIHWADDNYFRDLECATTSISNDIREKIIDLAKQIDNQ